MEEELIGFRNFIILLFMIDLLKKNNEVIN